MGDIFIQLEFPLIVKTVEVVAVLQEFQNIYQQFFPHGDPTKFANFVFNVFDANKVSSIAIVHRMMWFAVKQFITSRTYKPSDRIVSFIW